MREIIQIPSDAEVIISTSSKGDQAKWRIEDKWVKQNTRGYEDIAEYVASLILKESALSPTDYIMYYPCELLFENGKRANGCYSYDFRGSQKQEVSLERLFEKNFESTIDILGNTKLSTAEKFEQIVEKIKVFTNLDVSLQLKQMLAFDAFILNEDRHTNNILFLYDFENNSWEFAPLFDHGLSLLSDITDYPLNVDIEILKRKVKAKPLNTNFKKQLILYDGPPFIKVIPLIKMLRESPYDLGRIVDIVEMQLENDTYQKLFIQGDKHD